MTVLGTKVPGIREVIQHGENGWLCETSAESIRTAVIQLMNDKELRQQLGKHGRLSVVENYGLDRIIEIERQLYEEVISSSA